MGQYHEQHGGADVMQAPQTDQALTDRVNRLQSLLIDLRNVLEPFLIPGSDCEREALDKRGGSALETWIGGLVDSSDVSLTILEDIRERLYIPSVFSLPQVCSSPGGDRKVAL